MKCYNLQAYGGLGASYWQHLACCSRTGVVNTTTPDHQGNETRYRLRITIHSTPPLGGFPSEYCHAVRYWKTRMAWLPDGKKFWRYVYSFWQNARMWHTHFAWWRRPRFPSIARQKSCARTLPWSLLLTLALTTLLTLCQSVHTDNQTDLTDDPVSNTYTTTYVNVANCVNNVSTQQFCFDNLYQNRQ